LPHHFISTLKLAKLRQDTKMANDHSINYVETIKSNQSYSDTAFSKRI